MLVAFQGFPAPPGGKKTGAVMENVFVLGYNFLDFKMRTDNPDWLQPVHLIYDKEPQRVAYNKLEIFNVQLPLFAEVEPNFNNDGECWLYVMYQAHIKKTTPREVLKMDPRLERFADTNPGFRQFENRFRQALADPDLMDLLRMEASERIRQAGMKKAIEKENSRKIAQNLLKLDMPVEEIANATGLTADEVCALREDG